MPQKYFDLHPMADIELPPVKDDRQVQNSEFMLDFGTQARMQQTLILLFALWERLRFHYATNSHNLNLTTLAVSAPALSLVPDLILGTICQEGQIVPETLQIKVMGDFSHTAPINCPKTAKVNDEACQLIINRDQQSCGPF